MNYSVINPRLNLFVCVLLVSTSGHCADVDYTLSIGANAAIESQEEIQKAQLFVKPQISLQSGDWSGEIRAVARVNLDDSLNPTGLDTQGYTDISKPIQFNDSAYMDIQEAWASYDISQQTQIKFGKQILNWGSLDELRVLDVVNPQQFREFVFEDLNSTKLGLWGATFDTNILDQKLTLFVSADQTVHESPAQDSPFIFKAPELRFGFPFSASASNGVRTRQEDPDLNTYALRIKGQTDSLDYSVVVFSGPDYNPVASLQSSGIAAPPTLVRAFGKRDFVGFGASTTLDSAILRTEYGFYSDRSFNTFAPNIPVPLLGIVRSDQHLLAVGIDQQFSGNFLITAQWLIDKLEDDSDSLIRQQMIHIASVGFRKPFLNERLTMKGRWVFTDSGSDGLVQLSTDYAISDNQSVRLGFDLAYGREDELFGQFGDRSRLKFEFEQYFN